MTDLSRWVRPCELPRCDLDVVAVQDVGGKLERFTLDVEPASWEAGGRWLISSHQPHNDVCNVVRARRAGAVFGGTLHRPHREVCRDTQQHRPTERGGRS